MSYLEKFSDEELLEIFGSDVEAEIKARGYKYGWYKPTEYAGDIYILVNPAFPNLVKIGYANNVEKRVKSFNNNSGLPDPYHVYATYKVKKRLEDLKLHNLIDSLDSDLRHAKNREFYEMSPEKAYEILSAIAEINGDTDLLIKNPLHDEFFEDETKAEAIEPKSVEPRKRGVVPDGIYFLKKKIKAWNNQIVEGTMRVENGKFIVQKGSICCPIRGKGWTTSKFVDNVRNNCDIIDNVLQEDVKCNSPSMSAAVLTWMPENGWDLWKTEDGQSIDIFRRK